MRIFAILLSFVALPAAAHEFWLEPTDYQIEQDGRLEADIVNGMDFGGSKLVFFPQRFEHFIVTNGAQTDSVNGRSGDRPALNQTPMGEGLHIVAYQARDATVDYETWEEFQNFVDHKDFGDVLTRHQERGLPEAGFEEVYSRYSKTLIGVGNSAGADRRTGLETEIVALTNPYTDDLTDGFQVQLFYRQDVRANTQLEVFEKTPEGDVTVNFYRTDADGIATFPVIAGNSYMLDAVVLREPTQALMDETGAVWETLWANLTFAAPE